MENPPIEDRNASICSQHFLPENYVSSVLPGHGPLKKTLKPEAVPSVFSFVPPAKRRKISEARIARTEQRVSLITEQYLFYYYNVGNCSDFSPPVLSRSCIFHMDIYPEETLQHDREVQIDMFPACSTP